MIEIRYTTPQEYRIVEAVVAAALLGTPSTDEQWARKEPSYVESVSISAWQQDTCVGHAGQFLVDTLVPGGAQLSTCGVTRVAVLPTHRRRGVATKLIHALIDDALQRDCVLMSLRASETELYPRFGFGLAGEQVYTQIDPFKARPLKWQPTGLAIDGRLQLLKPTEILEVVKASYNRSLRRVGAVTRPDCFWPRYFESALKPENGTHVVAFLAQEVKDLRQASGYAHYSVGWRDDESGAGTIIELVACDDQVELALWDYLLNIDLIQKWERQRRPKDDLVIEAMADRRAYKVIRREDEQWVRLLNVDRALRARAYNPVMSELEISVHDPYLQTNTGVWRISAEGAQRLADQVDESADLVTDIATLSAAYLGGISWSVLTATGRAKATKADAVRAADLLFKSLSEPYCGSFF